MILLKYNVSLAGIQPEAVFGALIIYSALMQFDEDLRITSGLEGDHGPKSLHFVGFALDIGIKDLKPTHSPAQMAQAMRNCLNQQWDVVEERDHIHVEFQPKNGR